MNNVNTSSPSFSLKSAICASGVCCMGREASQKILCATKQVPVVLFPSTTMICPGNTANSGTELRSSFTRLRDESVCVLLQNSTKCVHRPLAPSRATEYGFRLPVSPSLQTLPQHHTLSWEAWFTGERLNSLPSSLARSCSRFASISPSVILRRRSLKWKHLFSTFSYKNR